MTVIAVLLHSMSSTNFPRRNFEPPDKEKDGAISQSFRKNLNVTKKETKPPCDYGTKIADFLEITRNPNEFSFSGPEYRRNPNGQPCS
jgi:hypothetical protein